MKSESAETLWPPPDPRPIRLLVVDDHPLLRFGVAALVANHPDIVLVAEASDGREGVEQFRAHNPDITLMDLQMPAMSGIDALMAIRELQPAARVIILTTYSGDIQVLRAMKAGAQGYLVKNLLHKDLLATIRAVHAGQKMMSPAVAAEVATYSAEDALTSREVDVLRFLANGCANKEIAYQLSITEDAVKSRVKNILTKLHANDRTHAVTIGLRRGIIEL
ncbi:MAG TPA: response regulator transcription factor [Chthoniobacterales bacterium]|nr:response regulator transcription factor [Chthoniobacterales bacterium]